MSPNDWIAIGIIYALCVLYGTLKERNYWYER